MQHKLTENESDREWEQKYTFDKIDKKWKKNRNEANPLWMVVNHIGFYACVVDTTAENMR